VRDAEPLFPDTVALMIAFVVGDLFFAFTVAFAEESPPADVSLMEGDTVAAPTANQETSRPCSGDWFASYTTAIAVVLSFRLISLAPSLTTTLATGAFVTVIVDVPD
jgi:hypothetical protein